MCEKPLADDNGALDKLRSAALNNGSRLHMVRQRDFESPVRHLKERVSMGAVGTLISAECHVFIRRSRYRVVDLLFEHGPHFVALLQFIIGDIVNQRTITHTDNGLRFVLEHSNGSWSQVSLERTTNKWDAKVRIRGSDGEFLLANDRLHSDLEREQLLAAPVNQKYSNELIDQPYASHFGPGLRAQYSALAIAVCDDDGRNRNIGPDFGICSTLLSIAGRRNVGRLHREPTG